MHRLGLVSLAARADGLVRHVEEAVGAVLRPPPPHSHSQSSSSTSASSTPFAGSTGLASCLVLSPAQLREMAEGDRILLRKPRGGADAFWLFEVLGQQPGGLPEAHDEEAIAGSGATAGTAAAAVAALPPPQRWPQPSLVQFVVLLRGVKLRYMTKARWVCGGLRKGGLRGLRRFIPCVYLRGCGPTQRGTLEGRG